MTHSELCGAILVTGDTSTSNSEGGLYVLSNERASNPVWKNSDGSRFIFNSGGSTGWRIGQESGLTSGNYYCKGKHILMIFTIACRFLPYVLNIYIHESSLGGSQSLPIKSEKWSGRRNCGSNGSVRVQCTKINGMLFERILTIKYGSTLPYSKATKRNRGNFL